MFIPLQDGFANESTDRAVEDIIVRFIINAPAEDFADTSRLLFLCEEAQWFYQDYISEAYPYAQPLGFKSFFKKVVEICPVIWKFKESPDEAIKNFNQYKQTIPVRGAALFNASMDRILLVQGMESPSWSFPRGKIAKDEEDVKCAVREVQEEINYDIAPHITHKQFIERNIRGKNYKIYLCKDIPEDYPFRPTVRCEINEIKWLDFKSVVNKIKNSSNQDNRFFLVQAFIRPIQDWIKRNRGEFNESKLKQQVELHLKHTLGLSAPSGGAGKLTVADPGREILDLLKKSAEVKKDEKDTEFLKQLVNKSSAPNSAATPLVPTSAPLSAPQYYPNPNMPPAPAPLLFGFPPMNGFIPPQMPPHLQQLFQQSQHQQFLNGLPQFLTPQNFGNQFQKFQSAHLPPHLLLGPPGPLPVHPPSSAAFLSHQHGDGNVINMAPNAHDLKRPSFIRNQGETKELLSILNKPKQPSKKPEEDGNVGSSTDVKSSNGSGNDYSKGLLALLSKKKEDPAETVATSKQQQDQQQDQEQEQPVRTEPVPLQLGSPMQEKPKPKPKLRMLKREPTNSETNQPQSQPQSTSILSPSPSASLLDLLKPRSSTATPVPMATTDLPSLESDLSSLQQRIDEDYENDKSIHSPCLNEDTFSPRSTSNGSDAGAGAGGRKLKMLKRGETLDSALSNNCASENGSGNVSTADATVAYTAPLGKAKYAEFDNQSVVSTIQFSDNDENEDELEEVEEEEEDSSAVDFKNEQDDQNQIIEEEIIEEDDHDEEDEGEDEYEQFESYDEDEEAFVENERLKEFDSDEEQGEDLEYQDGEEEEYNYTENDSDDDDDDHFVDSSEAYYNEHINEESAQQDKAVEYEAEPEQEPETATATPVVPNPPVEQTKPKFQLLGAKKSSPAPGLLSLLRGNGETDATKAKPLSLDDIESSLTPTASPQVQPVPTSGSSNAKNEIFGLFNKPSPQEKLSSAQSTRFATPVNDPSSSLLDLLHKKVQVPTEAASEYPKQQQQPVFLEDIENQQQQRPASALSYAGSSLTNSRPPMAPSAPTKLKITQAPLDVSDLEKSIPTFSNSPMIKHVQPQPQQQQQFQNSPMMQYQPSPAPVAASPAVIGFPPTPVPFMNSPAPQFQQLQPQPHQFNQSSFPGYQQLPQSPFQQHQHMPFQQQPSPAPMSAGGMMPNAPGQFPVPFGGQHPHPFQNHNMIPQEQQQQPPFHNNIGLQMNGNAAQIQSNQANSEEKNNNNNGSLLNLLFRK